MALQIDAVYELVGPDGTRAVFNDSSDPDFIGYLDGDQGITGLDSPEVRESADTLVEADGGIHGQFFYGRRPVVIQGSVWPDTVMQRNQRIDKLQRASNALRADCLLYWTEDGSPRRMLKLRRQQPVRVTGPRLKTFQIPLVSANPRILSADEESSIITAALGSGFIGFSSPLTSPLENELDPGSQGTVINEGNWNAQPRFRIDGPVLNPKILNNNTGEFIELTYNLTAGHYIEVDTGMRTVMLDGSTNRYSTVKFPTSTWWQLEPGLNDIRLQAASYSSPAALTVYWRHAWI